MSKSERVRIFFAVGIQIILGTLDILGVALIGLLGAIAINGVSQSTQGDRVNFVLGLVGLENAILQVQVAVIGLAAALLLICRTMLSVYFTRKTLHFLSSRSASLVEYLITRLFAQPLVTLQAKTTQETIYSLSYGVNSISMGIISTCVSLISDVSILSFMAIGLFVVDPILALSALVLFGAIGLFIYRLLHKRAGVLGQRDSELTILANQKISDVMQSYRELIVGNHRNYYIRKIVSLRKESSSTQAEILFLPYISKYILETSVIVGVLGISALQFSMHTATHAVATLAFFLAAATRIAPAVMRVQQGAIQIRGSIGIAAPTIELIKKLEAVQPYKNRHFQFSSDEFYAGIKLENVSVTYPKSELRALNSVNVEIFPGSFCAIVGPSGSGKSTLIDVILGVLPPDSGIVKVSNLNPLHAFERWPGKISYVPQEVSLISGTIRENLVHGDDSLILNEERIVEALRMAQLLDFVNSLPDGMNSRLGDRGANLSGGQRQRLGIARALVTRPLMMFFDEATSALDSETESAISQAIQSLRGSTTIVTVAHRLSTVRAADTVIYLESGFVKAVGSFQQVRTQVPNFDRQAKLMGL